MVEEQHNVHFFWRFPFQQYPKIFYHHVKFQWRSWICYPKPVSDSLKSCLYILWNISSKLIYFTESSTVKWCDPSFDEATFLTGTLLQIVEQSLVAQLAPRHTNLILSCKDKGHHPNVEGSLLVQVLSCSFPLSINQQDHHHSEQFHLI